MPTVGRSELKRIIVFIIRAYQIILSPILPPSCIYTPTCSDYAIQAVSVHGAMKGMVLAVKRIMRCHPWHKGGFDPVPEVKENE
jgi:putative membrane protein insertion efficiency factor